jgi:hypothetical protein
MIRLGGAVVLGVLSIGLYQPVFARPDYLARYQADPFRRAEVDGCRTCHVAETGGGARNDFGAAFDVAGREITPLLRASHPQQFTFQTVTLPDGASFAFSDPQGKFAVLERQGQKVLVDLTTLGAPRSNPVPAAANRMSFFVTSEGIAAGGQVGGLAGADRFCQGLAKEAGAGDRTWRAYLSTSFEGKPAANAGDRIGSGPWYNAKGVLVAKGPADLHARDRLESTALLTEKGEPVGDTANVFTGSMPNGTAAVDKNCQNWTSASEGEAMIGNPGGPWASSGVISCNAPAARLFCFAAK